MKLDYVYIIIEMHKSGRKTFTSSQITGGQRAVQNLRRHKMIRVQSDNGRKYYALTDSARALIRKLTVLLA